MKRLSTVALISLVTIGLSIPVVIEGRSRLLTRLQQCYPEVPTEGRQFFESPCHFVSRQKQSIIRRPPVIDIRSRKDGGGNDRQMQFARIIVACLRVTVAGWSVVAHSTGGSETKD